MILSDSLSSLQAIFNLKYDHPILVQILELYMNLTRDGKKIVFIWVSGHVDIRGNSAADSVAKDAFVGDISVELIPFSDLNSRANKYYTCGGLSGMSSRKINYTRYFRLRVYCLSSDKQKRRDCDSSIAHLPFSHSFPLLKGEEPPVYIGCDKCLTIEHLLLTCSDFIEMRVTIQLNHCEYCLRIFRLRRFFQI